jgi:hypothetical protein
VAGTPGIVETKEKVFVMFPTFESLKSGEIDSNGISNNKIHYLNFISVKVFGILRSLACVDYHYPKLAS